MNKNYLIGAVLLVIGLLLLVTGLHHFGPSKVLSVLVSLFGLFFLLESFQKFRKEHEKK